MRCNSLNAAIIIEYFIVIQISVILRFIVSRSQLARGLRPPTEIAGSNPARGMDVCLL